MLLLNQAFADGNAKEGNWYFICDELYSQPALSPCLNDRIWDSLMADDNMDLFEKFSTENFPEPKKKYHSCWASFREKGFYWEIGCSKKIQSKDPIVNQINGGEYPSKRFIIAASQKSCEYIRKAPGFCKISKS